MNIKTALAKSIGVNLITHNRNVSISSVYIAEKMLSVSNPELLEIIRLGGLLHDIGKMTYKFQELLTRKIKKTGHKYRHNEIGGAFINCFFNSKNIKIDYIANSVYWHHGISRKMNDDYCDDIIDEINDDEIKVMNDIVIELLDESYILPQPRSMVNTPNFYEGDDEYNENMSIIRTCIISADRIVSMLEENNINLLIDDLNISMILDNTLNNKITKRITPIINKSPYQPEDRFILQQEISNKCGQTTIIKAPAGFGKTMIGVIWASLNNRKNLWVCPRNVVAESVYYSILTELDALELNNVTVELYLTGGVKMKNHDGNGEFNSDIIVTNIDNFLAPSINDVISDRLFLTHSANIIFDEYQELVTDAPYFACFINLMRARHHHTNSKTLLLSATPIDISHFWDTIDRKTIILPDKINHYPAAHNKKYLISVTDHFTYTKSKSNLVILNSISEAQTLKYKEPTALLFHSKFSEETKQQKFETVITDYGKKSPRTTDKQPVIATLIARASFDVSFHNIFESCLSPEATIQSIGRCDRFGDYPDESTLTIFKLDSNSERAVIDIHYDQDLMENWYNELKIYDGKRLTLNELYVIYNGHTLKHTKERKKYFNRKYRNSLTKLRTIYPIRYNEKKDTDIKIAGSNKLRSVGNELFFMVNNHSSKTEYVGPFLTQIYKTVQDDFKEDGRTLGRILGSMKAIMKQNSNDFEYSDILKNKKKITIDDLRKNGKKSNTPYIRYDEVYHPDYGLITEARLNNLK